MSATYGKQDSLFRVLPISELEKLKQLGILQEGPYVRYIALTQEGYLEFQHKDGTHSLQIGLPATTPYKVGDEVLLNEGMILHTPKGFLRLRSSILGIIEYIHSRTYELIIEGDNMFVVRSLDNLIMDEQAKPFLLTQ